MSRGTVCVISLTDVANYGSCLQEYATSAVFRDYGWNCYFVNYHRRVTRIDTRIDRFLVGRGLNSKPICAVAKSRLFKDFFEQYYSRKDDVFNRFRRRNILLTSPYNSEEELRDAPPVADIYCTGSDQVWNSIWNEGFEEPLFLCWAPENKPRIAFSASIGRESIDDWEKPLMFDALVKYKAISMREYSGVRVLGELGIPNVRQVLDPTLMLTSTEWSTIETVPNGVNGEYILSYQLNDNESFERYTKSLSEYLGLPIVKICYRNRDRQSNAINIIRPEVTDYIGLIDNASCVVTDSFHATAFSISFGKPFVSISPNRFSTRIDSLLKLTGTEDRRIENYSDMDLMGRFIDFENVSAVLSEARKDTSDFLRSALYDTQDE